MANDPGAPWREKVLTQLVAAPYDIAGREHRSGTSIGVSLFGARDDRPGGDVLKRSDVAMYQAKAAGRNTVRFFDPAMQAAVEAARRWNRPAPEPDAPRPFELHYQPQVGPAETA
jgi:predicted signal transduction protein with EAL and GGDEF domain